jgi:hypothetical protein
MKELQNMTSNNIGVVKQYFKINNLFINPSKTHYVLFQARQGKQEANLKFLIRNKEIPKVESTDFLGLGLDSTSSWEIHIERTSSILIINVA